MSDELQLPARIVKKGEIVRSTKMRDITFTFEFNIDPAVWEELIRGRNRVYALPHQIGVFERQYLDDGAIDSSAASL